MKFLNGAKKIFKSLAKSLKNNAKHHWVRYIGYTTMTLPPAVIIVLTYMHERSGYGFDIFGWVLLAIVFLIYFIEIKGRVKAKLYVHKELNEIKLEAKRFAKVMAYEITDKTMLTGVFVALYFFGQTLVQSGIEFCDVVLAVAVSFGIGNILVIIDDIENYMRESKNEIQGIKREV